MTGINGLNYEVKILLAWGESISGNKKITEWLMKNGFPELGLFHFALRNEDRSRDWLMNNKFPHLLAMIRGIEGDKEALKWLQAHGFDVMHDMALVGDRDETAYQKLLKDGLKVYALLAKKMQAVKDDIEMDNADWHKINP